MRRLRNWEKKEVKTHDRNRFTISKRSHASLRLGFAQKVAVSPPVVPLTPALPPRGERVTSFTGKAPKGRGSDVRFCSKPCGSPATGTALGRCGPLQAFEPIG